MTEQNDNPDMEQKDSPSEPNGGEASDDGGGPLSTNAVEAREMTDPVYVNVEILVPRGEPSVVRITIDGKPRIVGGPGMACKGPDTADSEAAFVRVIRPPY